MPAQKEIILIHVLRRGLAGPVCSREIGNFAANSFHS
jgi:hypothetical protein